MHKKTVERWSPWILLVATILLWQIICSAFSIPEYLFPSPWAIGVQLVEFSGVIAGHAWRTFWVTMAGFGIAIVVGVLLGFVIGSSRIAYAAVYPLMTAFNAVPKAAIVPRTPRQACSTAWPAGLSRSPRPSRSNSASPISSSSLRIDTDSGG